MIRCGAYVSAALVLVALSARLGLSAPAVAVIPESPRPGEVLFVTLRPDQELLRASCSWNGRSYAFLPNGDVYSLVLPVSVGAHAGMQHATIYWKHGNGEMGELALAVRVRPRKFGIQRLRLSRAQESKYSAPETTRERKLIGAALSMVSPDRLWQGSFQMPVQGRVSTAYGLQRYVNGRLSYRHRGVDIGAPEGTPVKAAADGVVLLADASFLLHGQTIVLDHGQGVSSLYLHLSSIEVAPGQRVAAGQVIGRVGSTGVATGPHLHFAVYVYHEAVDPFFWMDLPKE
jgi:murein DD-endopeptidase MepM/ murein hydrolase activator NlpD